MKRLTKTQQRILRLTAQGFSLRFDREHDSHRLGREDGAEESIHPGAINPLAQNGLLKRVGREYQITEAGRRVAEERA